jgi:hypothetical protein
MSLGKIKRSLLILFLAVHCSISGWWDMGHMAVAKIAYEELKPEVKEKADRYLMAVSGPFPNHADFIMASIWADDISRDGLKAFFKWHISSRPYDPDGILSASEMEKILAGFEGTDLVWVLGECVKTLSNPEATLWTKGFMLRILLHMVGDVHQPAHCVSLYNTQFPEGDQGGNLFKIKHPQYTNLHSLFDSGFGIGDRMPQRPMNEEDRQYLDNLVSTVKEKHPRRSLDELDDKIFDHWRQESYDIGVQFSYANITPGAEPSAEFIGEGKRLSERQLALAGYRLADLLNSLLD